MSRIAFLFKLAQIWRNLHPSRIPRSPLASEEPDYWVAGVAASVTRSNGSIGAEAVAVTGVGNRPGLATDVAGALVGSDGSDAAVEAAAVYATRGIDVLEDLYGSVDYKTHLAGVFTARAVKAVLATGGRHNRRQPSQENRPLDPRQGGR